YDLVVQGRLPAGEEGQDALAQLSAAIVQALRGLPGEPAPRPALTAEAVEVLLAAVSENTAINIVRDDGGITVLAGGRIFGGRGDVQPRGLRVPPPTPATPLS